MGSGSINAKRIALIGILGALAVITVLFAALMPTGRLSLYALSSFYVSIVIMEYGIGSGWLFYVVTALLSLIVVPDKIGVLPYVLFFGVYGIIKMYIEKIRKLAVEILLKLLYFNISIGICYILAKEILFGEISINISWWALIVILEVVFIVYDYVYSLFIQYYDDRLRKILKPH